MPSKSSARSAATSTGSREPLSFDPKLVVTTDNLSGYDIIASLGIAEGYSPLDSLPFTGAGRRKNLAESMNDAVLDMINNARAHDAQAILAMRYQWLSESGGLFVYGTCVTIRPHGPAPIRN